MDGLTITAGDADEGSQENQMGGAVLLSATAGGNSEPGPNFEDCDFIGNRSGGAGGAVAGWKIGATIKRCFFSKNQTSSLPFDPSGLFLNDGGGAVSHTGSLVLVDCLFQQNESFGPGGAVDGPGQQENVLYNCTFIENTADTQGGGAFILNAELVNCLFDGNVARGLDEAGGGGLYGSAHLTNCTFFNNDAQGPAGTTGGGAFVNQSQSSAWNSIFWANTSEGGVDYEPQLDAPGLLCPRFCDIQDFVAGGCNYGEPPPGGQGGNIDLDPEFSQPTGDNRKLYLRPTSLCIDTGNMDQAETNCRSPFTPPGLVPCDLEDVDEDLLFTEPTPDLNTNDRVVDLEGPYKIDMGAYEFFDCLGDICGTEGGPPDGFVGINDLLCLLGDWGPCPSPPTPCPADICGPGGGPPDGTVSINDLLCLLANWGCPSHNDPMPATVQGCMARYMPDIERTAACITALSLSGGG